MTDDNINIYNSRQEYESEVKISDLVAFVSGHKLWFILSLFVCMLLGVFYIYRTQSIYSRTVKVLVDESNQDATLRNLGVASAGMMRMRGMNSVQNEEEVFMSPDLMQTVVERLGLETIYTEKQFLRRVELYHNSPIVLQRAGDNPISSFSLNVSPIGENKVLLSDFRLKKEKINSKVEAAYGDTVSTPVGSLVIWRIPEVEKFRHDIKVTWGNSRSMAKVYCKKLESSLSSKQSSVIILNIKDTYPQRAEAVLNSLLDVYNETWITDKNRASVNTSKFIGERLVLIEQELKAVEESLRDYKSANQLTDLKESYKLVMKEYSDYKFKSFEVSNKLSVAKFIRDYLNDPTHDKDLIPSNLGVDNNKVDSQISEYNSLVLKRDRLLESSSPNNPVISDLNASISSLKVAVTSSVENLIVTLELQLSKLAAQENQMLSMISSSSGQEMILMSIERQRMITQNLYIFLLQKREENELASLINVGNTRIVMRPNGSDRPSSPRKKYVLALAFLMGLGLPFGYFIIFRTFDTTVKNRKDLESLSVPFLAEIPKIPHKKTRIQDLYGDDKSLVQIIVQQGKRDAMNEAFRVFRANVDLMLKSVKGAKVVMFTSFNPNAGKTFTSINLAAGMALKRAKVLLVDLDLRKGTLGKAVNVRHSGIASYLNCKTDDFQDNVSQLSPGLYVLPVGTLPPNPAELLLSERFKTFIDKARQEYDYVILDCPPAELVVDSTIITEYVDMTVFVARAGRFDKRMLPLLETMYREQKFKSMALMLNGVDMKYRKYGYGSISYGYGYGNLKD